jgi:hypothetical protein
VRSVEPAGEAVDVLGAVEGGGGTSTTGSVAHRRCATRVTDGMHTGSSSDGGGGVEGDAALDLKGKVSSSK